MLFEYHVHSWPFAHCLILFSLLLFDFFYIGGMKKMLLMGSEGAGKSSMHSVIFANYPAKETHKIGYTVSKKQHKFKLMGNLVLDLWDCGGQDTFMDNYFMVQRQTIFKNVDIVIYVFDVEQAEQKMKKSLAYWKLAIESVEQQNEDNLIFILIHKIDTIPQNQTQQVFERKKEQINSCIPQGCKAKVKQFFATSIWDETLYQAWSQIAQLLIPNRERISSTLQQICESTCCQEAALFERSTLLILGYCGKQTKKGVLKYEKIANIVKHFKLTCNKSAANIEEISIQTGKFSIVLTPFTKTESILIIYQNPTSKAVANLNIANMAKVFQSHSKESIQAN